MKTLLMAWTTDGRLRPPSACHGRLTGMSGYRGHFSSTNYLRLRLRSSWKYLVGFAIPTVYANGSSTDDERIAESQNTTTELVAESRPEIVITDSEIQAVLDKETGHDRLRAMFTKE